MPASIVTLTLNPAVDVSCEVGQLVPWHKLRCGQVRRDPGGGGINVARAIARLGTPALAVFASAGANGKFLEEALAGEAVEHLAIAVAGNTRENITVYDRESSQQYRLVFPGEALDPRDAQACCDAALKSVSAGGYLVASGSLPPGVPPTLYGDLAGRARHAGAQFVLDASGEALRPALERPMALLKVSESEFMDVLGLRDRAQIGAAAREISGPKMIAITAADRGALLVGADFSFSAEAPAVTPVTSVGAGDSFLAGLLYALSRGMAPDAALRTAVAAGSAALFQPGTALCRPEMVEKLKPQVRIRNCSPALAAS